VAATSVKRGAGVAVTAVLFCLTLLMAGCQSVPAGTSGSSVHFTAQGDIGLGAEARQVLDTVAGLRPQLNLALGDLPYEAGIDREFCDMVKGKLGEDFPYEVLTGNHESDGRDGDIENIVNCLPNRLPGLQGDYGTQWYVDVPEKKPLVRFVMVSPGIDFQGGQQVDLVLSGDDHLYQRSHQLGLGPDCPELVPGSFSAACVTDSDPSMVNGAGTVFATVGVGGAGLYAVNENDPEAGYFAAWSGKNHDPAFGTLDVTATGDQLSARFVPAKGFNFTDTFTIGQP